MSKPTKDPIKTVFQGTCPKLSARGAGCQLGIPVKTASGTAAKAAAVVL